MSKRGTLGFGLCLAAALAATGCATKNYVRQEVAVERDARVEADNALAARIEALRADLDTLRSQYGARIVALEDGLLFALPVTFAYDDASVRPQAQPALRRFAAVAHKYYPSSTITIEGFADPAGSRAYNQQLSLRRAENVRRELAALGLRENPVRTVGYGEARQVYPGAMGGDPGAQANRRVVFVIENTGREGALAVNGGSSM